MTNHDITKVTEFLADSIMDHMRGEWFYSSVIVTLDEDTGLPIFEANNDVTTGDYLSPGWSYENGLDWQFSDAGSPTPLEHSRLLESYESLETGSHLIFQLNLEDWVAGLIDGTYSMLTIGTFIPVLAEAVWNGETFTLDGDDIDDNLLDNHGVWLTAVKL